MARVKQIDRQALEAKQKLREDEVERLEAFARKGSAAAAAVEKIAGASRHFVQLRIDADLLSRIDTAKERKRSRAAATAPSRHEWIMEAILEKLDREP